MGSDPEQRFALSVAICSLDRRASLFETLDSVECQQWSGLWEVLVIDNGSEDDTVGTARARARSFPVPLRVFREPRLGLSFARNRATQEARGRVLLFIDDDVTCRPGWLAAYARAFESPDLVGAGGRILPVLPPEAPPWWKEVLPNEVGGPTSRYDFGSAGATIRAGGTIPTPFGANMGISRKWLLALGGFRTDLGWGQHMIPAEETEFFHRVRARGGRLLYLPSAAVDHWISSDRLTFDYYVRWQQGKGRARAIMNSSRSPLTRLAGIAESLVRASAASLDVRRHRAKGNFAIELAAVSKRERAKGTFCELVGLKPPRAVASRERSSKSRNKPAQVGTRSRMGSSEAGSIPDGGGSESGCSSQRSCGQD